MNLFFDLDGTLMDSRERLYKLFQFLVPASTLSFEEYWKLKRNKISHQRILEERFSYSENEIGLFNEQWMGLIEKPQWITFDKPFEGVTDYLNKLKDRHELYLITARQFEDVALLQVKNNAWTELFKKIFITKQQQEKYDLLNKAGIVEKDDWFIGDTGKDIETGKKLGIHTAAVTSGFLNKERLMEYAPDVIVDTVLDLSFN